MPGSPEPDPTKSTHPHRRPLHPAAALVFCGAAGLGLSFVRSPVLLATAALILLGASLWAEGKRLRGEVPFLLLALIVFAAHLLLGGRPPKEALPAAGAIALRLLALVYLMRWAARMVLPGAARWLFGRSGPRRPRPFAILFESGRMTVALLPLALSEAERQHLALQARAIRPGRGLSGRARYLAAWLLPYLGTMLRVGDAYGEALHARGYAIGARRASASVPWGLRETAVTLASLLAAVWMIRVS